MGEIVKYQNESYKKKCDIVREFINKNFEEDISIFLKTNEWEENTDLCVNLINDKLTVGEFNYINNKLNLPHFKDRRTIQEYACDLVLGWVVEDAVVKILSESIGFDCSLSSTDRQRKFLRKPRATPDIEIRDENGRSILLEVVKDYKGYWSRYNKVDLRDQKYPNLKKDDGILLGIDFERLMFFVLKVRETTSVYIESHFPFGGKPAHSISLDGTEFYELSDMKKVLPAFLKKFKLLSKNSR